MLAAALIPLPLVGCASAATLPQPGTSTRTVQARPSGVATRPIDRLTAVAKRRYAEEVRGGQADATLRRWRRRSGRRTTPTAGPWQRCRSRSRT